MIRAFLSLGLFCGTLVTSACSGDSTSSEKSRSVEGRYRLMVANGYPLPVLNMVYSRTEQTKLSLREGTLSLHADGKYNLDLTVGGTPICYHDVGTFTVSGSIIEFHSTQQDPVALSTSHAYSGGQLSATGMTFGQFGADPLSLEFLAGDPATLTCYTP